MCLIITKNASLVMTSTAVFAKTPINPHVLSVILSTHSAPINAAFPSVKGFPNANSAHLIRTNAFRANTGAKL